MDSLKCSPTWESHMLLERYRPFPIFHRPKSLYQCFKNSRSFDGFTNQKLKMNFSQLLIRCSAHTPVSGLSDSSAEYGLDLTLRCNWTFRWTTRFACTADHSIWNAQDKYIEKITVHWENVQYVHLLELPIRKSSCSKSSPVKTHSWRPRQRLRMQRCQELEAVCAARSLTSCSCWCVLKLFALHGSKLCAPISVVCLFICVCAWACLLVLVLVCLCLCVLSCLTLGVKEVRPTKQTDEPIERRGKQAYWHGR